MEEVSCVFLEREKRRGLILAQRKFADVGDGFARGGVRVCGNLREQAAGGLDQVERGGARWPSLDVGRNGFF